MGTVFTIDIRDPGNWSEAIRDVVSWLHDVDQVFSTYKHDSDISRLRRGELALEDANPDVAAVLALCADARAETAGYFTQFRTVNSTRPDSSRDGRSSTRADC